MGLYLCIIRDGDDLDGVEVGAYADFDAFRDYLVRELESGRCGSRFPTLNLHPDSDGEWSTSACASLRAELVTLGAELRLKPPRPFSAQWQAEVARSIGQVPKNAFESFLDVDGEPLVERLQTLVDRALQLDLPILFQ